jgi:AcrR family transcriptional regulator
MARPPIGRQQLLDAAREELLAGNGHLDLSSLVRRAGLTTGAVYHHFGSKNGLLTAVHVDYYDRLERALADRHLGDGTWLTREHERALRMVDYCMADPLSPLLLDRVGAQPDTAEIGRAYLAQMSERAADNIRSGQRAGQLDPEIDPDLAGAYIIGGIRDAIAQQLRLRPRPSPREVTAGLWRLISATFGAGPQETDQPR